MGSQRERSAAGARVVGGGVAAGLALLVGWATPATAAKVLRLPVVTSPDAYADRYAGADVLRVPSLTLRRFGGGQGLASCGGCPRAKGRPRTRRPSPTSRRITGLNWILRPGRTVKVTVSRRGYVGRYVRLVVERRDGGLRLVYRDSGCLAGARRTACPPTTPPRPPQDPIVPKQAPSPPKRLDTVSQDFTKECTQVGQSCNQVYALPIHTEGGLHVQFTLAAEACALVKVHVALGLLGPDRFVSPPLSAGQSFSHLFTPAPLPAGGYLVTLDGEGVEGGCNTGTLHSWGGRVTVTRTVLAG